MHQAILVIGCANPRLARKSLEPDIKNDRYSTTAITNSDSAVTIEIKSQKLNHLKAMINSYLALVSMLDEIDKVE